MQINTANSAAVLDTNKDGTLSEIKSPALKQALAGLEGSGWNASTDTISEQALGSLVARATQAADKSPTVRKAAEAVSTTQARVERAQKEEDGAIGPLEDVFGYSAIFGTGLGLLALLVGFSTAGIGLLALGAIGAVGSMVLRSSTADKRKALAANVEAAKAEHEVALTDLIRTYQDVQSKRVDAAQMSDHKLQAPR